MNKYILTYEQPAQLFSALSHPVRLAMLELLLNGEACVCHIQSVLGLRQAYASQHLNILRQSGIVNSRKDGTRVYYELSTSGVDQMISLAKSIMNDIGRLSPEEIEPLFEFNNGECRCPQCAETLLSESTQKP